MQKQIENKCKSKLETFSLNDDVTNAKIEAESLADQTTTIDLIYLETKHIKLNYIDTVDANEVTSGEPDPEENH